MCRAVVGAAQAAPAQGAGGAHQGGHMLEGLQAYFIHGRKIGAALQLRRPPVHAFQQLNLPPRQGLLRAMAGRAAAKRGRWAFGAATAAAAAVAAATGAVWRGQQGSAAGRGGAHQLRRLQQLEVLF